MTIEHVDFTNHAGKEDFCEPDATVLLVDCLCGKRGNKLRLAATGPINGDPYEALIFRGICDGQSCQRALELRLSVSARERVKP